MGKKNRIVKSCTFDESPTFRQFVASQKNFSQSIRWLILDYIKRRGGHIDDVCGHFEQTFIAGDCITAIDEKL